MPDNDGWNQYAKHVLAELQRLSSSSQTHAEVLNETKLEFIKEIQAIRIEIAMLKIKAGIWGLVAGAIPPIAIILIWTIRMLLLKS